MAVTNGTAEAGASSTTEGSVSSAIPKRRGPTGGRGRTAEDECMRISEALTQEHVVEALTTTGIEPEADITHVMNPQTFALVRDVLLKKASDDGYTEASWNIYQMGDLFHVEAVQGSSGAAVEGNLGE